MTADSAFMTASDGTKPNALPTLTWESIINDAPPRPSSPGATPPPPPPPPTATPAAPMSTSAPSADEFAGFLSMSLNLDRVDEHVVHDPPAAPQAIPTIREATPVPEVHVDAPMTADATTIVPTMQADTAHVLPGAQPEPMALPTLQPVQTEVRPAPIASPLAVVVPPKAKKSKRRVRRGLKLIVMLLILGGLVAAAIVYGRPYIFPDDWEANAKPYGDQVESVTGAEFSEAVTVTAEPSAVYGSRSATQLTGDWVDQIATWRALGLATGDVTEAGVAELLAGQPAALYSTLDGQIYHDDALPTATLDAELMRAMSTALLDQQFGWTLGQDDRTLDDAALVSSHVMVQATATQEASEFATPLEAPPTGPLAYLPAVLSYRVLAPMMYAELLADVAPADVNPLVALDAGPGPIGDEPLLLASSASLAPGDNVVTSATAMDRSFWYLVFAGHLDASTAYEASESLVESALTVADRSGTTCAYATFSGGDLEATAALRTALESWVAAVPAEMTASFSVLGDGGLQVVSCDPGTQVPTGARLGVARELAGWRSAEIATIVGVGAANGGEAEVAAALDRLAASSVGADLAGALLDSSPTDAAAAARAAVVPIVTPPPPLVGDVPGGG